MKKYILALFCVLLANVGGLAATFNHPPAGLIKGARIAYSSSSAIVCGVGYGDIGGVYWEITGSDPLVTTGYTLTGLGTSSNGVFQYIYIDGTNSVLPYVTLKNSTTAPSWNTTSIGWYNGVDRCIAAVRITAAGAIANFNCPEDDTYQVFIGTVLSTSNAISTTYPVWTTFDCTNYLPANASYGRITASAWWTSGTKWASCQTAIQPNSSQSYANWANGVANVTAQEWSCFPRGVTKSIQYLTFAPTANGTFELYITGYRIER